MKLQVILALVTGLLPVLPLKCPKSGSVKLRTPLGEAEVEWAMNKKPDGSREFRATGNGVASQLCYAVDFKDKHGRKIGSAGPLKLPASGPVPPRTKSVNPRIVPCPAPPPAASPNPSA